jgi:hypothetical protein
MHGEDDVKRTIVWRPLLIVLIAVPAALSLTAGCGASAKQQLQSYVAACKPDVERVNAAYAKIQAAFSSLSTTRDKSWNAAAAAVDEAAAATQAAADDFGTIKPPAALVSVHQQLLGGLQDRVKAFGVIGTALKSGSFGPTFVRDPALGKLLNDGNARRTAWKDALVKQCQRQGVTIPWQWQ